jgi:hypothetical protein
MAPTKSKSSVCAAVSERERGRVLEWLAARPHAPRIDDAVMVVSMLLTILTALFTAALGLATFVAGQIVVKLFEPALDLRSLFGEIARDFIIDFGQGSRLADGEKRSLAYLDHAGVIRQKTFRVAWYRFFQTVVQLPPKEDVLEAAGVQRQLFLPI